jgi:hypothetical protein
MSRRDRCSPARKIGRGNDCLARKVAALVDARIVLPVPGSSASLKDGAFTGKRLAQMRELIAIILVIMPTVGLAQETPSKPPAKLTLYKTVSSAACSGDVAVWIDPETRVYYLKGDKFFGKTTRGGYNCRNQADAAGYRGSKSR